MSFEAKLEIDIDHVAYRRELTSGIKRAVDTACVEGADEARRTHQYQDRTGDLTGSIRGRLTGASSEGAEGEIVAAAKYASFVEGGTDPHEIRARRRLSLRWEDTSGVHFARSVQHPGTAPRPFMGQAYTKAERVLERELDVVAEQANDRI